VTIERPFTDRSTTYARNLSAHFHHRVQLHCNCIQAYGCIVTAVCRPVTRVTQRHLHVIMDTLLSPLRIRSIASPDYIGSEGVLIVYAFHCESYRKMSPVSVAEVASGSDASET
jgi:hypothetical protein